MHVMRLLRWSELRMCPGRIILSDFHILDHFRSNDVFLVRKHNIPTDVVIL